MSGGWDDGFYEWEKGRILEYTDETTSASLEKLSDPELKAMQSYPCLFAYEGSQHGMRVGRITSFTRRKSTVLIEFEFDAEIPEIAFSDVSRIFGLLDIRKWEMSRTHWAVKEGDLLRRLRDHQLIPQTAAKLQKATKSDSMPPPSRAVAPITTLQRFIAAVLRRKHGQGMEVFFRGHSSHTRYKLEPSLFRKDKDGNYLYLRSEHLLYRELQVSNSADFSNDTSTLDKLVRMQHFSLPTRLLDITSNPLIALYFACKSNPDEDGEVIAFIVPREEVKYFDSDTASCIANLARLPRADNDEIIFPSSKPRAKDADSYVSVFNEQRMIARLLHFIREEKPYFEPKILPHDLKRVVCVKGKKTNDRISSQSGAFLLFGQDAKLNEKGDENVRISRFKIGNKSQILKDLDALNINESTVFPYIEKSAQYVAEKFRFKADNAG
jgi:hypothetical protein